MIVRGIIGVVAALTLPNLNSSTGDKEKVAKVKKIYSNLEDAYGRATAVYGPHGTWFINDTTIEQQNKRFAERMTEFMKVSKSCGKSTGCFSSSPLLYTNGNKKYDNYVQAKVSSEEYMYILADGTSLSFQDAGKIFVDIDGPNKGKNQESVDIFYFCISDGKINPDCVQYSLSGTFYKDYEAASWVIMNDNMDYLKCSGLNWETKTSCK